jgi:hypothetical protein
MLKIIRLKLAIWMLRTARHLSDRAEIIIRDEEKAVQEFELMREWSKLSTDQKRDFLDDAQEGRL